MKFTKTKYPIRNGSGITWHENGWHFAVPDYECARFVAHKHSQYTDAWQVTEAVTGCCVYYSDTNVCNRKGTVEKAIERIKTRTPQQFQEAIRDVGIAGTTYAILHNKRYAIYTN